MKPEVARRAESGADRCLVCGGTEWRALFRSRTHERRSPGGVYRITHSSRAFIGNIRRCVRCQFAMLPAERIPAVPYADGADPIFLAQADVRIRNAERLLSLLPPPVAGTRLLDVGAACGFLLAAAGRLGYSPHGVEPSRWAVTHARAAYGHTMFEGGIEDVPYPPGYFGVVTLADTIEHLRRPDLAVERVRELLAPGGAVVILTPDTGSLAARLAGRHWWGLLDDHYCYFDRATLRRLLEDRGLRVERLHSFGRSFPLGHWAFKLSQYSGRLHRAADGLLRALRLGSREVTVNLGDQMVCVARRP